jgi:hypothetical protein
MRMSIALFAYKYVIVVLFFNIDADYSGRLAKIFRICFVYI